jgi:hypothetical protein
VCISLYLEITAAMHIHFLSDVSLNEFHLHIRVPERIAMSKVVTLLEGIQGSTLPTTPVQWFSETGETYLLSGCNAYCSCTGRGGSHPQGSFLTSPITGAVVWVETILVSFFSNWNTVGAPLKWQVERIDVCNVTPLKTQTHKRLQTETPHPNKRHRNRSESIASVL